MYEDLKISGEYDGFIFLAESVRNPPFLFRAHRHVELELNVVVSGEITYVVEGKRCVFKKRSLLWFFPSQEHQLVDLSVEAAYYVLVFRPKMIEGLCLGGRYEGLRQEALSESGILQTLLGPVEYDLITRSMEGLLAGGLDAGLLNREAGFGLSADFSYAHGDPVWLNAGLRYLLLLCWRHQEGGGGGAREVVLHPAVRRALECLSVEDFPGCLEELASLCNVSGSYLSRMFNAQVGVPLAQYRNSLRLTRFWGCYGRGGGGTILEAVYEAGFGSYPQFYRVFRQAYGRGPREVFGAEDAGARRG